VNIFLDPKILTEAALVCFLDFVFIIGEYFRGVSYLMVGISGESISPGPIPKGLGLLAALSKSKSFSIV
jgi:hypothetical protein